MASQDEKSRPGSWVIQGTSLVGREHCAPPALPPESALRLPTHHVHFGIIQAVSLHPSTVMAHVIFGVYGSQVTKFSIAPCCENPWQKQDNPSLSSSVL